MDYSTLMGMPRNQSANGGDIDRLIFWVHVLMAVLFVGWLIYFVYVLVRFRRGSNAKADYHGVRNHSTRYVEFAVVIVEVICLVVLSIPVWAERIAYPEDAEKPLLVNVIGQQFQWNFHYAGPDGKFGPRKIELIDDDLLDFIGLERDHPDAVDDVVSQNVLHLPVNRPVLLRLSSRDVIHSFFIPTMRVKTDLIPGMRSTLWFTPVEEVTSPVVKNGVPLANIACAQLCGNQHSVMKGFMTVESEEKFHAWMAAQNPASRF